MDFGELESVGLAGIESKNAKLLFQNPASSRVLSISLTTLLWGLLNNDNVVLRRNTFRGWNLGTAVTDKQWEAIRSGFFEDLFIGDYWVIGGVRWVICDFNYFDSPSNHVVIMPKTSIGSSKFMENEEEANEGYYGSYVRKTGLNDAKSIIYSAFGSDHIATYRTGLINSVSSAGVQGHINEDVTIELGDARMFCLSPLEKFLGDSKDFLPLAITILNGKGNKYFPTSTGQPVAMMTRSIYKNKALVVQWENGATSSSTTDMILALRPVFAIKG